MVAAAGAVDAAVAAAAVVEATVAEATVAAAVVVPQLTATQSRALYSGRSFARLRPMTVRPATHSDLQGILDIYNDAVLTTTATYDYEPRTLEHRATWFEEHAKQDYAVFVAEDGGRIVGWSALNPYHARMGYRFTTENSVYVAADQRGKGIGKLLLEPLISAARKRGLRAIIAAIDADNEVEHSSARAIWFRESGAFQKGGFQVQPLARRGVYGAACSRRPEGRAPRALISVSPSVGIPWARGARPSKLR